jgi:hypothetical protein
MYRSLDRLWPHYFLMTVFRKAIGPPEVSFPFQAAAGTEGSTEAAGRRYSLHALLVLGAPDAAAR